MFYFSSNDEKATAIKGMTFRSFIYFHGEIENRLGYDLVQSPTDLEMGVNDCIAHVPFGDVWEAIPCKSFIWMDDFTQSPKGLIVALNDTKALEFAQSKYDYAHNSGAVII